ncbi:MAG: division/cell wall cluster transcriptional repressor MraZ [Clostridia bacterium]|nr:division/cell wall cluster transcriptional repressor MraZ [Clostridia bacterium]
MDFLGVYNHSLDAKNRIFIPSKYREYLGGTFVVCKAPDECLYVYSQEEWEKVAAQVKALPGTAEYRRYKRNFFGNADIVELDKQGRFTIKAELLQYANLSKEVVIAGSGNKFEVWNAEDFERDTNKTRDADDLDIEVIF